MVGRRRNGLRRRTVTRLKSKRGGGQLHAGPTSPRAAAAHETVCRGSTRDGGEGRSDDVWVGDGRRTCEAAALAAGAATGGPS
jgi:hypothetical protein